MEKFLIIVEKLLEGGVVALEFIFQLLIALSFLAMLVGKIWEFNGWW